MITLETIDYVINMTGASYENVRIALLDADGDVDRAIELLEERRQAKKLRNEKSYTAKDADEAFKNFQEKFTESCGKTIGVFQNGVEDLINAIKEIFKKGNARKLLIEKDGEVVLQLSLTASAIGLIAAPIAGVIGLGAAITSNYRFLVVMEDGSTINVEDYVRRKKENKEEVEVDEQIIVDEDEKEE